MKVQKILMVNFKRFTHKEVRFGDKTAFIGMSGSGKTTVLTGIIGCLTVGEFGVNPIQDGKESAYVSTHFINAMGEKCVVDCTLKRTATGYSTSVSVNSRKQTLSGARTFLRHFGGVNEVGGSIDGIKLLASSEVLEAMENSALSDLIMSLLEDTISFTDVMDLAEKEELSEAAKTELTMLLDGTALSPQNIDELFTMSDETRLTAKRNVNAFKQYAEVKMPEGVRSLEEIEKELEEVVAKEGKKESAEEALRNYQRIQRTIEGQKKRIVELREEAEQSEATAPNPKRLEELSEKIQKGREQLTEYSKTIGILSSNIAMFEETLSKLSLSVCPISEKICCTVDKSAFRSDVEAQLSDTKEALESTEESRNRCAERIKKLEEEVTEYRRGEREYTRKLALIREANSLEENLPTAPKMPEILDIEEDFTERKRLLKEERSKALEVKESMTKARSYKKHKSLMDVYTELAGFFGKKGPLRRAIVEGKLEGFNKEIKILCDLIKPEFRIELRYGEDGVVPFIITGSGAYPYKEGASGGETRLALFILTEILNRINGLNILIMDDLDRLDAKTLMGLTKAMNTVMEEGRIEQILISSVNHDDTVEVLTNDGYLINNMP